MAGGELIDLRSKIDEMTDAVLTIEQQETGMDRSELVRNILHEHCALKVRKAILIANTLEAKGIVKDRKAPDPLKD